MSHRRAAYYEGQSCGANIRTRHPDGTERPCAKRGVHARSYRPGYYDLTTQTFRDVGPSRVFFCDQHAAEHDAGANVLDPERPALATTSAGARPLAWKREDAGWYRHPAGYSICRLRDLRSQRSGRPWIVRDRGTATTLYTALTLSDAKRYVALLLAESDSVRGACP